MDLGGRPVVDHVIRRVARASGVDEVLLAITDRPEDDALAEHLAAGAVRFVRGSAEDVLSRFALAAEVAEADTIVRITADCPLMDPEVIHTVVTAYATQPPVDFCSNTLVRTYPIGMDVEVFSRAALEQADKGAVQPHEREHVTPYLYQHPERFRLRNAAAPDWARRPDLRLTVDEQPDLELLRRIIERLGPDCTLHDVLRLLEEDKGLAATNRGVVHRHVEKPQQW